MPNQNYYKLKKWGQLASFQKELVDETNVMITTHHAKTLMGLHSGSIIRSTTFIYRELFGEYIPKLLNKYFNCKLAIDRYKIERNDETIELNKQVADTQTVPPLSLNLETGTLNLKFEYKIHGVHIEPDVEQYIKEIFSNIVNTIEKECIELGENNQEARDYFERSVYEVFESDEEGKKFFKKLLSIAMSNFHEAEYANNTSEDEGNKLASFQIMLFLPSSPENETGCFFYPYFEKYIKLQSGSLAYFEKIAILLKDGNTTQDRSLIQEFYKIVFTKSLLEVMSQEKLLDTPSEDWKPELKDGIKELYHIYSSDTEPIKRDFIVNKLSVDTTVFSELLKNIRKNIEETYFKKNNENIDIDLWKNAFTGIPLLIYQHADEGIVGEFAFNFLPIRIQDQQLEILDLKKRNNLPYMMMGLLEGNYHIGSGSNPAAVLPLTAKGQLLGALIVIKNKEVKNNEFSTSELVTLEYISRWIADQVQEAKDSLVFKYLTPIDTNKNVEYKVPKLLSRFLSAIAILTNVVKVNIKHKKNNSGLVTPKLNFENGKWMFIIPENAWSLNEKVGDYEFHLTFTEKDDIVKNYRKDIEKLYRTVLHMLGLRASGIAIDNNDSIYKKIGKFALHLSTQTEFLKKQFVDIDVSPLSGDITYDLKSFSLEQISAGQKCNQCHNDFSKYNLFEDGEKARKVKDCMRCWWTKAEEVEADSKKRAQVRSLVYKLGKAYQDGIAINGENVKRYADGIFF